MTNDAPWAGKVDSSKHHGTIGDKFANVAGFSFDAPEMKTIINRTASHFLRNSEMTSYLYLKKECDEVVDKIGSLNKEESEGKSNPVAKIERRILRAAIKAYRKLDTDDKLDKPNIRKIIHNTINNLLDDSENKAFNAIDGGIKNVIDELKSLKEKDRKNGVDALEKQILISFLHVCEKSEKGIVKKSLTENNEVGHAIR